MSAQNSPAPLENLHRDPEFQHLVDAYRQAEDAYKAAHPMHLAERLSAKREADAAYTRLHDYRTRWFMCAECGTPEADLPEPLNRRGLCWSCARIADEYARKFG